VVKTFQSGSVQVQHVQNFGWSLVSVRICEGLPRILIALLMLSGERSCINISSFFLSLCHSLCTGFVVVEEPNADWTSTTAAYETHLCRLTIEYQCKVLSAMGSALWSNPVISLTLQVPKTKCLVSQRTTSIQGACLWVIVSVRRGMSVSCVNI
jgi:hypothetical protein